MNTETTYAGVPIPVIDGLTPDQVVTLINCRGFEQYESMRIDYDTGKCPFCDPLDKKNKVIATCGNWRMWENPFPIKHTRVHLVMAPFKHLEMSADFGRRNFMDIGMLFDTARKMYPAEGGGLVIRYGTPRLNAGSVLHPHVNILSPDETGDVQITLAKNPKKVQEAIARMHIYGRLYAGAQVSELLEYEQKLVEGRI